MALQVDYRDRKGYYYVPSADGSKKCKIWICGANALWAEMYFFAKETDGKREQRVQLYGFLADVPHLERCLKSGYLKYHGLTFFADKMDADLWKAVKALTEGGIKVTIK